MGRKLVILHVDGLSANMLEKAVREGRMPFVRRLMDGEGYLVHRYRCGVPSTTPFAQAGILYGDNSEIPSFRWWDRERRILIQFGAGSTFKKVADKYFHDCVPLTKDGACIAACYPAGAADDFGIAYQDRSYTQDPKSRSAWHVLGPYLANPAHLGDWVWQTIAVAARTVKDVWQSRAGGRHPARSYVITDVLEEIFIHHLTRYAVLKAMKEGFAPIYAGFYAFDETAHAFGPGDPSAIRILKHVDDTIAKVAAARGDHYELLVLSDHGQVDTLPFAARARMPFGRVIADMLPGFRVQEMKGKSFGPDPDQAKGTLNVTMSGGLAHLYFAGRARRMTYAEVNDFQPELMARLSSLDGIAFVMARNGDKDVLVRQGRVLEPGEERSLLAEFDDPEILRAQISRLNSFAAAGDVVVFGAFVSDRQVNFEDQAGGHGSIGGEQLHPFVLAKGDWRLDTDAIRGAHELHPVLCDLRDRLLDGDLGTGPPQVSRLNQDHRQHD